jgi:predicted MPP superfamily phosphohydrolase
VPVLDIIVFFCFALSQWRIVVHALGFIDRRFAGRRRRAARSAVFVFEGILAAGYLCSFSDPVSRLRLPGPQAMIFGACTLAYLATSGGVLVLYLLLRQLRKRVPAPMDPARREALGTVSNAFLAAPFAAMGYGFVHRTDFHVREVDVPIPGLAGDLDGLRILQLSDIHLGPFLSESELARVIDASQGLRPHLAVVTGDLISQRGDPLDACIRQLKRVKADAGMFGCMGNHERYARAEAYTEQAAARAGIRFLRDTAEPLRFGNALLNVAGVDHQSKVNRPYLRSAGRLIAPGACNLLLSHNPDVFPVAARQGYNLVLAGHTHGGQVTVEILDQSINPARFYTPYVYGLYRLAGAAEYVTRGIGTIGLPARIGASPEITLLRLRKA